MVITHTHAHDVESTEVRCDFVNSVKETSDSAEVLFHACNVISVRCHAHDTTQVSGTEFLEIAGIEVVEELIRCKTCLGFLHCNMNLQEHAGNNAGTL